MVKAAFNRLGHYIISLRDFGHVRQYPTVFFVFRLTPKKKKRQKKKRGS